MKIRTRKQPAISGKSDSITHAPGTTGRYLVLMHRDGAKQGLKALAEVGGLSIASSSDFEDGASNSETLGGADALFLENLGVAVVDAPPEQMNSVRAMGEGQDSSILAVEAERIVHTMMIPSAVAQPEGSAFSSHLGVFGPAVPLDYLSGYRDAVNFLVDRMLGTQSEEELCAEAMSEAQTTWGLQITGVTSSKFSGRGVRVAVLDTGMDLTHPDFAGRTIVSQSFVSGQAVQDGSGHGTHCIGTACGPRSSGQPPRYGIAFNCEIYAGKVLSNQGSGGDGGILSGIDWAVNQKCQIVSMSLGSPVAPGGAFSQVYEHTARRAVASGTIIIAAAGNESSRPGFIAPVGHPANCPSILAVAAIDAKMRVAAFSCGGINNHGGHVDIAAPGVQVRSAWPQPTLYNTISGTSMATPHVAGIAALHAEASGTRGATLAQILMQSAKRLSLPSRDAGVGLVQAP